MPGEHFDVIIVGARCAGSPLATLLARAGLRVVVLEQATFPRPTLSSHLMEADGLTFLSRLGVLEPVRNTGVRFIKHADLRFNDFRVLTRFPLRFDDIGGAAFLRRHILDEILAGAAAEAGADMRMGVKVVEVLWDRGRVRGVRAQHDGAETSLYAPLVVGADGRGSTVAYMCGSRKYNVNPSQRHYYFTFFEGADPDYCDRFIFHRWGDRMVWSGPADGGLYLLGVSPEGHEHDFFRQDAERGLLTHLRACEPAAAALAGARIATKISGIVRFDGYFRQPSGPGWVLAGDAGHFKDPSLGRGIGDAFMQVETLVPAIISGLGGPGLDLDTELRRWGEWRDQRFAGHYWLATILGEAGPLPALVSEAMRGMRDRGEVDRILELFLHRSKYYDVFKLREVSAATWRLLGSSLGSGRNGESGHNGGSLFGRETIRLLLREPRRRWLNSHPALDPPELTAAPRARSLKETTAASPGQNGAARLARSGGD